MRDIFKDIFANVEITDSNGNMLLKKSNLFVDKGRAFIANVLAGTFTYNKSNIRLELGQDKTATSYADQALVSPFAPAIIINNNLVEVTTNPTEIKVSFSYTNNTGASVSIKELGLWHKIGTIPGPFTDEYLLARIVVSYSSIVISDKNSVTITWKLLF